MKIEILKDCQFEHKIGLKGLSSALTAHQVFDYLSWPTAKEENYWTIAEWASKYLMKDVKSVKQDGDSYVFFNDAKHVTIYPGQGKLDLFADTRKEYAQPRGPRDPWIHLLLEQKVEMKDRVMLDTLDALYMELEFEIIKSDKYMSDKEYDPNVHASQLSWYLTIENCKDTKLDFEGRPDYLWFGLPIYDNRFTKSNGVQIFLDYGTQKLIYGKDRNDYLPENIEIGKTYRIYVDVLPEIKVAFAKAKEQGWLKGAELSDMAVGSTNIGWEIPGTFDVGFKIKKISMIGERK